MIAAARLPLRSDPANNQFERPTGRAGGFGRTCHGADRQTQRAVSPRHTKLIHRQVIETSL